MREFRQSKRLCEGLDRFDQGAVDFGDGWRQVRRRVHFFFLSGGTGQSKNAGSRTFGDGHKEVRRIRGVFSTRQGLFFHLLHREHFLDVFAPERVSSRDEVPQRSQVDHQLRLFQLEVGDGDIGQGFVALLQEPRVILDLVQNGLNGVRQLAELVTFVDDSSDLEEKRRSKGAMSFNAFDLRNAHVLLDFTNTLLGESFFEEGNELAVRDTLLHRLTRVTAHDANDAIQRFRLFLDGQRHSEHLIEVASLLREGFFPLHGDSDRLAKDVEIGQSFVSAFFRSIFFSHAVQEGRHDLRDHLGISRR